MKINQENIEKRVYSESIAYWMYWYDLKEYVSFRYK